MKTIKIISIFGSLLFESKKENNTIKDTLEEAVFKNINLRDADLRFADLRFADLRGADLRNANLEGADLRIINLRNADLEGSNLRFTNLRNANLEGSNLGFADLRGADLRGVDLEGADLEGVKNVPTYCKWSIGITKDRISIGCKEKTIEGWDEFFSSEEEFVTKRGTQEFKQIQASYEGVKAYYNFLNR